MINFGLLLSVVNLISMAGGGGSSGGGGGGGSGGSYSSSSGSGSSLSSEYSGIVMIILVIFFAVVFLIFVGVFMKARKKSLILRQQLTESSKDKSWSGMNEKASNIFLNHQKDWSSFNLTSMQTYMSKRYYAHTVLMMSALRLMGRQNKVEDINILFASVVKAFDDNDNINDTVSVQISAYVKDIIFDTKSNKDVYSTNLSSTQVYNLIRSGDNWLIDSISQSTASVSSQVATLKDFADKQSYYYSEDWGYLLLPERGQLFKNGKFGTSDINNHIIGDYKGVVIQIYSYTAKPDSERVADDYIIAQLAIPKSYDDIVVKKKALFSKFGMRGLTKVETEWQDFNKKYDVFAADIDKVTSFELLNPTYMEKLEAVDFEVNLEVVDNVVYLYTPLGGRAQSAEDSLKKYSTMLELLKKAHDEMER